MRINLKLILTTALISILISCTNDKTTDRDNTFSGLKLVVDKNEIESNNVDFLRISIFDINNIVVTNKVNIYVNDEKLTDSTFKTKSVGKYTIYAQHKEISSNSVEILATTLYTQKTLLTQYTAQWCKFCPLMITKIENYKDNNLVVPIAFHESDNLRFTATKDHRSKYNIRSFPSAIKNLESRWNGTPLSPETNRGSIVKIGLSTKLENNKAKVDLKLIFGNVIKEELKVVVCLLENNINDYQNGISGNTDHNNTLRAMATELFGDEIPSDNSLNMTQFNNSYSIDLKNYNTNNCDIVAYVISVDDKNIEKFQNVEKVKLGNSINF